MRIVCQKCSAAYAIDDKFVTPKGVRAQCPRCRHLQLVKKDDASAATTAPVPAAAPPAPNPFLEKNAGELFDLSNPNSGTTPGTPSPAGPPPNGESDGRELMDFSELGFGSSPAPAAPPPARAAPARAAPAASPFDAGGSPFGSEFGASSGPFGAPGSFSPPQLSQPQGGAPPPRAEASPFGGFGEPADLFGQAGAQAQLPPLGSQPGIPPRPPPSSPTPSSPFENESTSVVPPEARCKSCGKQIFDPFDQALEICDDCRNKPPSPSPGISSAPTAAAPAARPSGPRNTGAVPAPEPYRMQSAYRDGAVPSGRSKAPLFAVVGVVAIAAIGYFVVKPNWVKKPPPLAKKVDTPTEAIDNMVNEWRLRYPDLTGTTAEYVESGDEQMARDTTQGYARAEESYQRALVLDSRNDRAIAGWVLALAFGRFGTIDDRSASAAEAMLTQSERRSGDPRSYVSHAHFLLARNGNFNDIKVLAERALTSASDKDKALGHLALGQAFLGKNQQFAADHFSKAATLDPKLKRAVLYQAKLMVQQGELKKAMDSIDKKLQADPDQWEAADMLARLYIEAGEPAKARKTYAQVPSAANDARAQMTLAMLSYQHEGQPLVAVKTLESVLAGEDQLDTQDVVAALGHLAAAKRIAGDLDGAAGAASRALEKRAGDLNAQVQLFLISIERNKAGDARGRLDPILGRLNDPGLELVFRGLVELIDGKAPEAQRYFVKAFEADVRRTDAIMLAGAAAARAKIDGKAWEYALKMGLKADPWRSGPQPVMAAIYVRPADLLKVARGSFEPLAREEEDPNPPLAEGLLAWFAEDLDGAAKAFDRVVHDDPNNGPAYAYRSFVALKKGQNAQAASFANKGVNSGREQALDHLALGLSLLADNKLESAKRSLAKAAELAPSMLLPKAKIGEIEGRQKRPDEARKVLTTVLLNDPLYREARRAQFLGGS